MVQKSKQGQPLQLRLVDAWGLVHIPTTAVTLLVGVMSRVGESVMPSLLVASSAERIVGWMESGRSP
jgi:hypothetical protein